MNKPIVGITMGDPAGSGPEITIKALADPEQYTYCRPIVVGDVKVFEQARKFVGREDIVIHRCDKVSDALFTPGTIDVLHLDLIEDINKFEMAKVSVEGGNAAFQCVKKVIELAMAGEVDATCTNALNKEAMNKALEYYHGEKSDGYTHFDGHTEIYATYTHTKKYTMMLAHHDLRVVHVSTHVSLREACDRVKKERVLEVIEIANKACKDMGIENPRIAVAGLNPHCGENGLFGREEIEEITPAIEAAKAEGITGVVGPCPPDSVFSQAIGGWYDIVVCMYHDQGHIPLKTVGFVYDREKQEWKAVEGVNVTLGLPIIRASVGGKTASCTVTVKAARVPVSSVTLDRSTLELSVDGTARLTATVRPENADDCTVMWQSSREDVATVSGGIVRGVAEGSALISATAGGAKAECSVTVSQTLVWCSVVNRLSHVTTDQTAVVVAKGRAYKAALTAESGYTLTEVNVKMGSEDVTGSAWNAEESCVNIEAVTGNIVITAKAEVKE